MVLLVHIQRVTLGDFSIFKVCIWPGEQKLALDEDGGSVVIGPSLITQKDGLGARWREREFQGPYGRVLESDVNRHALELYGVGREQSCSVFHRVLGSVPQGRGVSGLGSIQDLEKGLDVEREFGMGYCFFTGVRVLGG